MDQCALNNDADDKWMNDFCLHLRIVDIITQLMIAVVQYTDTES